MNPLEKVPFASIYPLQKDLRGTCFFSKTTFSSGLFNDYLICQITAVRAATAAAASAKSSPDEA